MRPLRLTMCAFGPYAAVQQLDFADLQGRSFFLIHGPTGSGKTTILDAICFALYGDTSGALRDSKSIRSDHATLETATEVEFDFSVGAAAYRIHRSPEQERPKKRGDGMTVKPAEAMLWELKDGEEPKLLVTGWSDVTKKTETLLGFRSSQFRQVVLLPQGDFRKLLTANSSERQEIMQTLFKTELYRSIEETLKAKAQELKKEFEAFQRERLWVQNEAGVESAADLAGQLQTNQTTLEQAGRQLEQLALQLKTAQQAVAAAQLDQAKLTEQAAALRELTELQAKVAVVEEKRTELLRAQQAATLMDAEALVERLSQEIAVLAQEEKEDGRQLEQARMRSRQAEERLAGEVAQENEREALAARIIELNQLKEKTAAIENARQAMAAAQLVSENTARSKAVVTEETNVAKAAVQQKNEQLQQLKELAAQAGSHKAALDHLNQVVSQRQTLITVEKEFIAAAKQLAEGEKKLRVLEERCLEAKTAFTALQQSWLLSQAAVMASRLAPGQPCPVCGSHEHPEPAVSAGLAPDEQAIKQQQQRVEKLEQEREELRGTFSRQQSACATLANRVKDLEQQLGSQAVKPIGDLQQELAALATRYEQAVAAQRQAEHGQQQLQQLVEKEQQLVERLAQAEQEWLQADSAFKAAQAVWTERQQAVPSSFHDPAVLSQAQSQALKRQKELKDALETAQRASQEAVQQVTKWQQKLENTLHNLRTAQTRQQEARSQLADRLQAAGFADQADYNQAKKTAEYRSKLAERLQAFDHSLAAAQERWQRAQTAAAGIQPPDIAALEQHHAGVQAQHNAEVAEHSRIAVLVARQEEWLHKLKQLSGKMEKTEQRFGVLGRLAEVANGSNEYRLTFQRFVLGTLLDDVAIAANERLKTMSRGRYMLQRTMDRARKNAAGGLDLEVFDHYTGSARGVGTLSGGETFLASLSLALGLADVVQSYAGGIHLDTILVDEGFGTLDPESLDFAIRALLDLQKGGRLVGIISHVPELKERIDARLEVCTTQFGSTACFQVG